MQNSIQQQIMADRQIKKFCLYGFLKNLRFFEAYLLLYLLGNGLNLFQIGLLMAIREIVINLFEIPSGLIADYVGRKKELYLCFSFYIISFLIFFGADNFYLAALAMTFFGLGEAFRSGTHKAMIYTYLDTKHWQSEKAYTYGRTRSYSLIGSAVSGILGIILILAVPADSYIFLFSIVPYILDLLLIMSYPKFLDSADKKQGSTFKELAGNLARSFRLNSKLRKLVIEEGMAEAAFSYIKDLIQPLLELIIVGSGLVLIANLSGDDNLKISLGLIYAVLNLCGSYFSKKAHLLKQKSSSLSCLLWMHGGLALLFGLLFFFIDSYWLLCLLYLLIYILHCLRKPLFVDEIDNHIEKSERATVISATSQLKSLFLMIFAPILGLIADNYSIAPIMLVLAIIFACTIPLLKFKS